jgi:hypothetical protein
MALSAAELRALRKRVGPEVDDVNKRTLVAWVESVRSTLHAEMVAAAEQGLTTITLRSPVMDNPDTCQDGKARWLADAYMVYLETISFGTSVVKQIEVLVGTGVRVSQWLVSHTPARAPQRVSWVVSVSWDEDREEVVGHSTFVDGDDDWES